MGGRDAYEGLYEALSAIWRGNAAQSDLANLCCDLDDRTQQESLQQSNKSSSH
jgi:hypothetical protein